MADTDETVFLSLIENVNRNWLSIRDFFPYPDPRNADERFANYERIVYLSKKNTVGLDPHSFARSLTF